ncbi:hypothetical protein ACC745_38610, partial [Rhizobium ruizarguesonis]
QAARTVPAEPEAPAGTLEALRAEAAACTRCPLHAKATQTVFWEGPRDAEVMFVGEQPGDQEDIAGRQSSSVASVRLGFSHGASLI